MAVVWVNRKKCDTEEKTKLMKELRGLIRGKIKQVGCFKKNNKKLLNKFHPSPENGPHFMEITSLKGPKMVAILKNDCHSETQVADGKYGKHER